MQSALYRVSSIRPTQIKKKPSVCSRFFFNSPGMIRTNSKFSY